MISTPTLVRNLTFLLFSIAFVFLGFPVSLNAQVNEFDDLTGLYESVFSELDDQYLNTGLLGERAFPMFPLHTCLGELGSEAP
ncbi:MAG: hypothetical protein AB8F78_16425 [Saprospiraceae bacterium]